jgi:hypothetical protein
MRIPAFVSIILATSLVAGCQPSGPDGPGDTPILGDDLDMDSYLIEGTIDGLPWSGEVCALNLIPSFWVLFEGKDNPYYSMQFEAHDKTITGGVVKGMWRMGGDVNYTAQINKGTFTIATGASAQEPGTIAVNLDVSDYPPAGGRNDRTVTGALNLTPVVTSDECIAMNDVDYLKESLETYGGPGGG